MLAVVMTGPAHAADPPAAPASAPASAPAHPHAHRLDEEREQIREHHFRRFVNRLTQEPEVLRQQCLYESEIATAPPLKRVVLTFDDGPEPGQTEHILAVLAKYDIPAAFFLIGDKAQKYPELVDKIRASGKHLVGNHSWDHPNFHALAADAQVDEVARAEALTIRTGAPKLFRYPYGNSSCPTNDWLHAHSYEVVGWHVDSCDWAYEKTGAVDAKEAATCGVLPMNRQNFVDHVLSSLRAHHGGIVLMHEIHPNTVRQLEDIIRRAQADGYSFIALDAPELRGSLR
jgi:peptidoglycan/xylan/chitin deacetylase (PgdA/CDA1 family)